jgi:hypothetical protein
MSSFPPSTTQRLSTDPFSDLPGIDTFDGLSHLLRGAIADEDSRIFSENLGQLAAQAERVVAGLRVSRHRDHVSPLLMDMLTVLRAHRAFVVNLDTTWRGLYEYAAYLQTLNNLRVLIGQWLVHAAPWDDELGVTAAEFELAAWRTLGEGMLLVDVYEQWLLRDDPDEQHSALGELQAPQVAKVLQWWQKLRR